MFEAEPVTAERGAVFAGCPNLVLTPHIAGVTAVNVESNVRVSWVTVENVRKHFAERSDERASLLVTVENVRKHLAGA